MPFGFHVADHGLDGGSTSQFAFDGAEEAALLSRDEDAAWILRIVAAVTLVDIGALDLAAGELLRAPQSSPPGFKLKFHVGRKVPQLKLRSVI